jgi:hypothetical protein
MRLPDRVPNLIDDLKNLRRMAVVLDENNRFFAYTLYVEEGLEEDRPEARGWFFNAP